MTEQHDRLDSGAVEEPLCDEAAFDELIRELVAFELPRRFAVVQVYGTRVDARIAAWGLAFDDGVEVFSVDRGVRMRLCSPDLALRLFRRAPGIASRIVWADPESERDPEPAAR